MAYNINMQKTLALSVFSMLFLSFFNFNFVNAQISKNNSGIGSGSQTTNNPGIGSGSKVCIADDLKKYYSICCIDNFATNQALCTANNQNPSNFQLQVRLNNPLAKNGINTIPDAVQAFMSAIVRISVPFIIVFFIWSGLSFILASGNAEAIKNAKNMFLYTIIGTLLILGAWTITNAIVGTINSIGV